MLLRDLVLGRGQPLPQLTLVKLLVGTHGLADIRHSEIMTIGKYNPQQIQDTLDTCNCVKKLSSLSLCLCDD